MRQRIPDKSSLLRRFPELAQFDGPEDREKAWTEAMRGTGWYQVFVWLALLAVLGPLSWAMNHQVMPYLKSVIGVHEIPFGVASGLAMGLSSVCTIALRRRRIERSLRQQLVERGHPACIACGYELRGLTEPRCPECGAAFDPQLLQPTSNRPTDGQA
jgi:hypothetical protein